MPPAQETKDHIIRSAVETLKVHGSEGLTMRKVAARAAISLGNLQYHYKDKTALLAGLAEYYFGECVGMLDEYQHAPRKASREKQLYRFILFLLDHVDHLSDMCRIFREIWALSARDEEIHRQLVEYYQASINKLSAVLMPLVGGAESANNMASLLLPYIEGYSITCPALPQEKKETARMLANLCWGMREDASE